MNSLTTSYYSPSGRTPIHGLVISLISGILAAAVLGSVYNLVVEYIPVVQISFLATGGYALALAGIVRWLAKKGHLRSTGKIALIGLLVGLAAEWLQWVFFAAFEVAKNSDNENITFVRTYPYFLLHPDQLWAFIMRLSEHGHWSVGHGSHENVKGGTLLGVWIIEGLVIALLPIMARNQGAAPYSEPLSRWAVRERLPQNFAFAENADELRAALELGDYRALHISDNDSRFAHIDLFQADGDDECCYLSLTNVNVTTDRKGKKKKDESKIVTLLRLTPAAAQKLKHLAPGPVIDRPVNPAP